MSSRLEILQGNKSKLRRSTRFEGEKNTNRCAKQKEGEKQTYGVCKMRVKIKDEQV
jgi:hypothetical protein